MDKDAIREYGKCQLGGIQLLSIIGEIEGHECVSENTKSTKYEHLLPILASVEEMRIRREFYFSSIRWEEMYPADLPWRK